MAVNSSVSDAFTVKAVVVIVA